MKEIRIIKYLLEEIPIERDKYYIIIKRGNNNIRYNIIEEEYILIEDEINLTDNIFNKSNIINQYNGYVDGSENIIFYGLRYNINFRIYGYGSDIINNKQIYIQYKYKLLGESVVSSSQVVIILVGRLSDSFVLNVLGNVEYINFELISQKIESTSSFSIVEYLNFIDNIYYKIGKNNIYCIANDESQYIYNIKYVEKNINGVNISKKNNGNMNMLINTTPKRFYYSNFKSMDYNIDISNIKYRQIIDGIIINSTDVSILKKDNYILDSSKNRISDLSDNLNHILYNDISSNFIIDNINIVDNILINPIINLRTSNYEKYIFTISNYNFLDNSIYLIKNLNFIMNNMNVRIKIYILYNNEEIIYNIDSKTLKNSFINGEQNILLFHNTFPLLIDLFKQYYLTNFNKIIAYYNKIVLEFYDNLDDVNYNNFNINKIILNKNEVNIDFIDNLNIIYTCLDVKKSFYIILFDGIINLFSEKHILIKFFEFNYYMIKLDEKNDYGSSNKYYMVFNDIIELNKFIVLIKEDKLLEKITNKKIIKNYNFSKRLYYNSSLKAFGNYNIDSSNRYITINIKMDLLDDKINLFIDNSFEIIN